MPIGQPRPPADKGQPKSRTTATTKTVASAAKTESREENLVGLAGIATGVLIITKNYADAGAVDMHAAPIAHEVAVLAENDDRIANIVDRLTAVGPYAALLTAVMPLALQILVNHDRIKPSAAGLMGGKVMSKEALSAKVEADILKAQAAFMREAREAQEEAREAQANLEKVAA